MSRDVERLLERAAGAPARLDDTRRLWRIGRRRRLRDVTAMASASTLLVAGLVAYGLPFTLGGGESPSDQSPSARRACRADAFGCVRIAPGEPITLGTLLTLSGENAALGLDAQRGAVLAVEQRGNQVAGHPIEWEHQDDLCAPEGGSDGSQILYALPRLVAVIGTSCSSAGEPAAMVLSEGGRVLISPSNTAPSLTFEKTHSPFYLRTSYNDKEQGAAMAEFAVDEIGVTSAATIHDGSPFGETLAAEFEETLEAAGSEITARKRIEIGQTNFRAELASIATTAPDLIYLSLFHEAGRIIEQARSMPELDGVQFAGGDGLLTDDWPRGAGASAEGVYISRPDLKFEGANYEQKVLTPYRERWGEPPWTWHAFAYDATNLVLDAVEAVALRADGNTFIPRTALRDRLVSTSGYAGIVGELSCNNLGDCNPRPGIEVVTVTDGNLQLVWERPH